MLDNLEYQEIENLGSSEETANGEQTEIKSNGAVLPLFQAALCLLILLAIMFLKVSKTQMYDWVEQAYKEEMSQVIHMSTVNSAPEKA